MQRDRAIFQDRSPSKVVIRLDNSQVALAIVGFIVVSIGVFAAGVMVGKQMADALPASFEEIAGVHAEGIDLDTVAAHRERDLLLTEAGPGTRTIGAELARPTQVVPPSDPSEAARIEAHRQIAEARTRGSMRSLGPLPVVGAEPARQPQAPLTLIARRPSSSPNQAAAAAEPAKSQERRGGYTLQVSAFGSEEPARVVADQLGKGGHKTQVREVTDSQGSRLWRVEVGRFAEAATATKYQRTFEKESGYSSVLVRSPDMPIRA